MEYHMHIIDQVNKKLQSEFQKSHLSLLEISEQTKIDLETLKTIFSTNQYIPIFYFTKLAKCFHFDFKKFIEEMEDDSLCPKASKMQYYLFLGINIDDDLNFIDQCRLTTSEKLIEFLVRARKILEYCFMKSQFLVAFPFSKQKYYFYYNELSRFLHLKQTSLPKELFGYLNNTYYQMRKQRLAFDFSHASFDQFDIKNDLSKLSFSPYINRLKLENRLLDLLEENNIVINDFTKLGELYHQAKNYISDGIAKDIKYALFYTNTFFHVHLFALNESFLWEKRKTEIANIINNFVDIKNVKYLIHDFSMNAKQHAYISDVFIEGKRITAQKVNKWFEIYADTTTINKKTNQIYATKTNQFINILESKEKALRMIEAMQKDDERWEMRIIYSNFKIIEKST